MPAAGLERDHVELQRRAEHERRPERRVAGERQLEGRREDPDPDVAAGLGWEHEDRLAEADLERERLHGLVVEPARVGEDGELVALKRRVGEDVGDDVAQSLIRTLRSGARPVGWHVRAAFLADPGAEADEGRRRHDLAGDERLPCRKPVARSSRLGGTKEKTSVEALTSRPSRVTSSCVITWPRPDLAATSATKPPAAARRCRWRSDKWKERPSIDTAVAGIACSTRRRRSRKRPIAAPSSSCPGHSHPGS